MLPKRTTKQIRIGEELHTQLKMISASNGVVMSKIITAVFSYALETKLLEDKTFINKARKLFKG